MYSCAFVDKYLICEMVLFMFYSNTDKDTWKTSKILYKYTCDVQIVSISKLNFLNLRKL